MLKFRNHNSFIKSSDSTPAVELERCNSEENTASFETEQFAGKHKQYSLFKKKNKVLPSFEKPERFKETIFEYR